MTRNIVLIKNEPIMVESMSAMIHSIGYISIVIPTGMEALAYLEHQKPLCVVLDSSLPDMSGEDLIYRYYETVRVQAESERFPPFIVLTEKNDASTAVRMIKLGARNYIPKDENFSELFLFFLQSLVRALENEEQLRTINRKASERVENQEKLQEIEQRLTLIMENITNIVVLHRPDGSYEWVSPSFTAQLGYTSEELLKASPYDYIHPDDIAVVYEGAHQTALQGMKNEGVVYRFRLKSGEYRWFESITSPVKNSNMGDKPYILAVSRDVTEQVQAYKTLQKSEAQFRTIIDASPVPYALNDQNNTITYLNPAFIKCFGYTLDDIPTAAEWWTKAYPDEDYRQWVQKTWRERLDTAERERTEVEVLEVTIRCKDGSERIVLVSAVQLEKEFHGTYVVIFYDITERIQAEQQIRRLALIAKETDNMVIITDVQGNIEWVNEGFTRLSEYTFEEARGKKPGKLLQGIGTDPETVQFMHTAFVQGEPFVVEALNYTKSGKEYWVQIHSEPLFDDNGTLINFFALQLDITKLKRREEELRRSEAQLRAVFDSSSQSYWLTDTNLRVLAYNKIALRGVRTMLERDIELGDSILEYVLPRELKRFMEAAHKALDGEANVTEEYYMLPSGEEVWYENLYTPTYNDSGIIIGLTISSSNVTERHRARIALETMNQFLEERVEERTEEISRVNMELTEIMGIAAHDLKNPLAGILSGAEILSMYYAQNADDHTKRLITNIILAGRDMLNIITNLLELNRIDSGQMRLIIEPVSLSLVADTLEAYRERATAKNIALHQHTLADEEPTSIFALANTAALRQVLDNLVSNAVKYSPHGKDVFVRIVSQASHNHARVRIEIEDEGPGISEEDKKKLFGKFARLSAQPTGGEHSTGLGLSIVKKMVTAMNGAVWCESEMGQGAKFIVELPKNA